MDNDIHFWFYVDSMTVIAGISRDKTMADKLIYIPNGNTQSYNFCRLQLGVETDGHTTKWNN